MTLDLRQLRAFVAVVRSGGFSKAAREARLTQPTLSTHIRNLEAQLGTRLFDRAGRKVVLTPAGRVFAEYAERILHLCDQAAEAVQAFLGEVRGRVPLEASTVPGEYLLPRWLTAFRARFPEVEVDLSVRDSAGVLARVALGEAPLGVSGQPSDDPRLVCRRLCGDEIILAAAPSTLEAVRSAGGLSLRSLPRLPLVRREEGSGTRRAVEQGLRRAGLDPDSLTWAATMGSTRAAISAAVAGLGGAFLPRRTVIRELGEGSLVEVRVRGLSVPRDLFLVTHSALSLSPAAACLAEFLVEAGRGEP